VNRGDKSVIIELQIPGEGIRKFSNYIYSDSTIKVDKNGFPVPNNEIALNLSKDAEIICEGKSVNIITTVVK